MNEDFLKVLACPVCCKSLYFMKLKQILVCKFDKLSFPILDGIPILLKNKSTIFLLNEQKL